MPILHFILTFRLVGPSRKQGRYPPFAAHVDMAIESFDVLVRLPSPSRFSKMTGGWRRDSSTFVIRLRFGRPGVMPPTGRAHISAAGREHRMAQYWRRSCAVITQQ